MVVELSGVTVLGLPVCHAMLAEVFELEACQWPTILELPRGGSGLAYPPTMLELPGGGTSSAMSMSC